MTDFQISNRTFGIELEFIRPTGVAQSDIARAISEAGVTCRSEGYNHDVRRHWKVVADMSLSGSGSEVVSPVLSGESGIEQVRTVTRVLTEMGCSISVSCGFHLHVFAGDFTKAQVARITKHFVKWETFFDHILPVSRRAARNSYVRSNRADLGGGYSDASVTRAFARIDQALQEATSVRHLTQLLATSRYYKLNLRAMDRQPTIEFRHHSGTVETDKVENWIRLMISFTEAAANGNPRVRRADTAEQTPQQELSRFFRTFAICKPVQRFYRERMRHFAERG